MHLSAHFTNPFWPPNTVFGTLHRSSYNSYTLFVNLILIAMNAKKNQARELYAQSGLNKTQIAAIVGVSRRTIGTWVLQEGWDRLRNAADHLPAILAENCYHIMGQLTEHYLSEFRLTRPVTHLEADTLHKLASTIQKMGSRTALNESMEILTGLLAYVQQQSPKLARQLAPHIRQYLSSRAKVRVSSLMPPGFSGPGGRIPPPTPAQIAEHEKEAQYDARENFFADPDIISLYKEHNLSLPDDIYGVIPPFGSTRKKS